MSRARGNKAKRDKGSILADAKNLLYVLHPAIQHMPKIERIEELNAQEEKFAHIDNLLSSFNSYSGLLKGRTDYKRLLELRDSLSPDWWQWLSYDEQRRCLVYLPQYSINERLNNKYHLKLKHYDTIGNHRTEECSLQRTQYAGIAA